MEPVQILKLINYFFMYIPIYVFVWCLSSMGISMVYKGYNPDKTYPEFVAMAYGGFAVLIFWMIFVTKL